MGEPAWKSTSHLGAEACIQRKHNPSADSGQGRLQRLGQPWASDEWAGSQNYSALNARDRHRLRDVIHLEMQNLRWLGFLSWASTFGLGVGKLGA